MSAASPILLNKSFFVQSTLQSALSLPVGGLPCMTYIHYSVSSRIFTAPLPSPPLSETLGKLLYLSELYIPYL